MICVNRVPLHVWAPVDLLNGGNAKRAHAYVKRAQNVLIVDGMSYWWDRKTLVQSRREFLKALNPCVEIPAGVRPRTR